MVYSGREAYAADHGGVWGGTGISEKPGLHASCLPFIRDNDVCLLGYDMMDATNLEYTIPHTMHAILYAYGVALLDNALLEPLARACIEEGRHEFMFVMCPLKIIGGTGSPINPIAVF
jgi:kynurenine formamidase